MALTEQIELKDLVPKNQNQLNVTDKFIGFDQTNNPLVVTLMTLFDYIRDGLITVDEVTTALSYKAPLNSPQFTGVPIAPTAPLGTNTTQIATMAALKALKDDILGGAGPAVDTLKELADLWEADETAIMALTALVGQKAPLDSPQFTGIPIVPTPLDYTNGQQAVNKTWVNQKVSDTLAAAFSLPLGVKRDFGAKGDAIFVTDAAITSGSAILTSASGLFTSAHVGKTIAVRKAGAGVNGLNATLVGTILSRQSATQVTLSVNASNTIVGPRTVTDAAMTANSATLTSATANFTANDIGKTVSIPGAWLGALNLTANIIGFTSATQVTLNKPARTAVTAKTVIIPGAWCQWGTDDTTALQNAINGASSSRRSLELEPGRYLTTAQLTWASNVKMFGQGAGISILSPVGTGPFFAAIVQLSTTLNSPLTDVAWQNFEIDGSGVRSTTYNSGMKGLYCLYLRRATISGMYVHDTGSTAIGNDFYDDSCIVNNVVTGAGQMAWETGAGGGASGIGIGTGQMFYEKLTVSGNICHSNFNYGIFVESQTTQASNPNSVSRGIRIVNNCCIENNNGGIGDHSTDGTIIEANTCDYNLGTGIDVGQGFAVSNSKRGMIINNKTHNNGTGINVTGLTGASNGYRVSGNDVGYNSTGIAVQNLVTNLGKITNLEILDNAVYENRGRGIFINQSAGTFGTVLIERNRVWNNGVASGNRRAGIEITCTAMDNLNIRGNIMFDDKATGSKTQSYGVNLTSGTYGRFIYDGNDNRFGYANNADGTNSNNADGDILTTGATITTQKGTNYGV